MCTCPAASGCVTVLPLISRSVTDCRFPTAELRLKSKNAPRQADAVIVTSTAPPLPAGARSNLSIGPAATVACAAFPGDPRHAVFVASRSASTIASDLSLSSSLSPMADRCVGCPSYSPSTQAPNHKAINVKTVYRDHWHQRWDSCRAGRRNQYRFGSGRDGAAAAGNTIVSISDKGEDNSADPLSASRAGGSVEHVSSLTSVSLRFAVSSASKRQLLEVSGRLAAESARRTPQATRIPRESGPHCRSSGFAGSGRTPIVVPARTSSVAS